MSKKKLKIIPLGGLGEIGKNMMAIEYGGDIMVIDAGLMFPEEEMLGIDLVIPDISFLISNKEKIRGIVITHGHEDHIGALPYVLTELNLPIYATKLTQGLISVKLKEMNTSIWLSCAPKTRACFMMICTSMNRVHGSWRTQLQNGYCMRTTTVMNDIMSLKLVMYAKPHLTIWTMLDELPTNKFGFYSTSAFKLRYCVNSLKPSFR